MCDQLLRIRIFVIDMRMFIVEIFRTKGYSITFIQLARCLNPVCAAHNQDRIVAAPRFSIQSLNKRHATRQGRCDARTNMTPHLAQCS